VDARSEEHRPRSWSAGGPSDEDEARERLLAAADACYAEKGPVRTRMSDIARRAGVYRSTVYYYFAKKDTLLAASSRESSPRPRRPLTNAGRVTTPS
jgi:AcrR family transcriptional regulator